MCLKEIQSKHDKSLDEPEIWYKVVAEYNKKLYTPYKGIPITIGKWYHDLARESISINPWPCRSSDQPIEDTYEKGYHFYTLKAAREMKAERRHCRILECFVTNIIAKGLDYYGEACVAKSFRPMRIIND